MISHEKRGLKRVTFRVQPRPRQMAAFPLAFSALRAFGVGSRFDAISQLVSRGPNYMDVTDLLLCWEEGRLAAPEFRYRPAPQQWLDRR
jgi:hypothetical protein